MLSKILLCLLVGLVAASSSAWKRQTLYEYDVSTRTFTGLHELADQYAGVVMKGKLTLQLQPDGSNLIGQIRQARYAQVHAELPGGYDSYIPESKLDYQPMKWSEAPFEIVMRNGTVHELIAEKHVPIWEANMIKAVVSQIQVDVRGENLIESRINQLPEPKSNSAVFKTMEDTVTGKCETLYDISDLPKYMLFNKPQLAPMYALKAQDGLTEITKTTNYSNCAQHVAYHHSLDGLSGSTPASAYMGEWVSRSLVTRVVLSGSIHEHYTIQSSVSTNKVIMNPIVTADKKGITYSKVNITLRYVNATTTPPTPISSPKKLGNLVYSFNSPFSSSEEARQGVFNEDRMWDSDSDSSEEKYQTRHPRSYYLGKIEDHSRDYRVRSAKQTYLQPMPTLQFAPECPFLPEYTGNHGKVMHKLMKVVENVQKLSHKIADDLDNPSVIAREDTLGKFVILIKQLRTMNATDLKQVTNEIYSFKHRNVQPYTYIWKVYRDAVAQAGTGPALVTVIDWIHSDKITGEEAATVLATLIQSTRQPTSYFLEKLFEFIKSTENKKSYVHETGLLSFCDLVRKVYVHKTTSINWFPVYAFGNFSDNSQVVETQYIPYLAQRLEKSMKERDNRETLVYIRALGNMGHPQILPVYEPYLEGKKNCTHFQRLSMVVSLDQLVRTYPTIARSVLYKLYQNKGELTEIRTAAVYLLMKTNPQVSMLQRMAENTHNKENNDVNSAVKSAILSAAKLQDAAHQELAQNAKAVVPLLHSKLDTITHNRQHVSNYLVDELNMLYKQSASYWGIQDSSIPDGFIYELRSTVGGYSENYAQLKTSVSNMETLLYRLQKQFRHSEPKQYENSKPHSKWASEYLAKVLDLQLNHTSPLEAQLFVALGNAKRFFSLTEKNIEQLPSAIKNLTSNWRHENSFNFTKFVMPRERILSFPLTTGLPFVYTFETPVLLSLNGDIRVKNYPEVVTNNKIHLPESINITSDIQLIVAAKLQGKLGFTTPFDHHHYVAGFDKKINLNLPVRQEYNIDLEENKIRAEFKPLEKQTEELFHYSSWPYTATHNLLDMKPISKLSTAKVIYKTKPHHFQSVYGQKIGMAFRVNYTSETPIDNYSWLEQYQNYRGFSVFLAPLTEHSLQFTNLSITYEHFKSTARSVRFQFGWEQVYKSGERNPEQQKGFDFNSTFAKLYSYTRSSDRQVYLLKQAIDGINSVDGYVYDASVSFTTKQPSYYNVTFALGTSDVDKKSRFLAYYNQDVYQQKPYEVCVALNNRIPNTNALDFLSALKFDPTATSVFDLAYGKDWKTGSRIQIKGNYTQSQERLRYLQSLPEAQLCAKQMKEGNRQLPICRNMTIRANYLDRYNFSVTFHNISSEVRNLTSQFYDVVRHFGYQHLDEKIFKNLEHGNHFNLNFQFKPDFYRFNVTVQTNNMRANYTKLPVHKLPGPVISIIPAIVKLPPIVVGHPSAACVVDKNQVNTFDNLTYPINLGKTWYIAMMHLKHAEKTHSPAQRLLRRDDFDYSLLVRETKNNAKEVRITMNDAKNFWEIYMTPVEKRDSGSAPVANVFVNHKSVQFSDKFSFDIGKGLAKIYALPSGEVKVQFEDFYVVYDGYRVKLIPINGDQLRGNIQGLCGTFDGETNTDFTTPNNKLVRDPRVFTESYAIIEDPSVGPTKVETTKVDIPESCYKYVTYANVISNRDVPRDRSVFGKPIHASNPHCTKHQTQYLEEDQGRTICFTVRPIPVCASPCKAEKFIQKNVEVHCVQKSNVSDLWKTQIQKGASPDFSLKSVTKTIQYQVPMTCV